MFLAGPDNTVRLIDIKSGAPKITYGANTDYIVNASINE